MVSEAGGAREVKQGERAPNLTELYMGAVMHDDFMKALRSAAQITQRTAHETAFFIGLTADNEYWISSVKRGEASGMMRHEMNKREESRLEKDFRAIMDFAVDDLLDVHFHPACDLTPSLDDLGAFSEFLSIQEARKPRPVMGVGIVDKNGEIELLLVRIISKGIPNGFLLEDVSESLTEIEGNLGDSLPPESTKSKLLDVLNGTGFYKATIISLPRDQKGFSELELSKLRDFFG